jgi:hypothetical protein
VQSFQVSIGSRAFRQHALQYLCTSAIARSTGLIKALLPSGIAKTAPNINAATAVRDDGEKPFVISIIRSVRFVGSKDALPHIRTSKILDLAKKIGSRRLRNLLPSYRGVGRVRLQKKFIDARFFANI